MDRGLKVSSKLCDRREVQRRQNMHRERMKNIRSMVDTSEPFANQLDHVRIGFPNAPSNKKT
eukprot:837838-Amphidinium_carterae.1